MEQRKDRHNAGTRLVQKNTITLRISHFRKGIHTSEGSYLDEQMNGYKGLWKYKLLHKYLMSI